MLDFVGQANRRYNFAEKFDALTRRRTRGSENEIEDGFPDVPRGCSIQLEKKARDIILENIRAAVGHSWSRMIEEIRTFEENTGMTLTLGYPALPGSKAQLCGTPCSSRVGRASA